LLFSLATDTWFSLSSKYLRDTKLAEYKLTNYGVVNPRTLENVSVILLQRRLFIEQVVRKLDLDHLSTSSRTLLLSAEKPYDVDGTHSSFTIKTQNTMTNVKIEEKYDAIVYATGYERSSWAQLLKNSTIGKHFGLHPSSASVCLVPSSEGLPCPTPTLSNHNEVQGDSMSYSSSAESSPPTSPDLSMFSSSKLDDRQREHQELAISRNYRLLPLGFKSGKEQAGFSPRIYLQGVEENSHGLSDTLLSVLGVRAGEVVGDFLSQYGM